MAGISEILLMEQADYKVQKKYKYCFISYLN